MSTYIVTGGAGFIGSNLVRALNERGERDVIVVDNLSNPAKLANLTACDIADFIDKRDFAEQLAQGRVPKPIAILHQGACSDTLEQDGRYLMANNYEYSKRLLHFALDAGVPFLYASSAAVYGSGTVFKEAPEHAAPLNLYGYSKYLFDRYVERLLPRARSQVAGFRYFNVYGPGEDHKGRMASVAWQFFRQLRGAGCVKLFKGSGGFADGEQQRDFVWVKDVVAVNLEFLDHPTRSGIFNLGTGAAASFNQVAVTAVNAWRAGRAEPALGLDDMRAAGLVTYIDFPAGLEGRYQSYTQADISRLRRAGCKQQFQSIEAGIEAYYRSSPQH